MDKDETLKYLNKINNKKEDKHLNLKIFGVKLLITITLFLIGAILVKKDDKYKDYIYENIFNKNLSFTELKKTYNKYLGGIFPIEKIVTNTEPVFKENLAYKDKSKYLDGVKLTVDNNYLVPVLESGLVVYIGEKEGYGNTIIIEGMDGIDLWYGNILTTSIKLYDYVEKGSLLGEVKDTNLYLVYTKESKYLNYEEYLK